MGSITPARLNPSTQPAVSALGLKWWWRAELWTCENPQALRYRTPRLEVWIVFVIDPFHAALDVWEHSNITRWQIMKAQVKIASIVFGITVDEVRRA